MCMPKTTKDPNNYAVVVMIKYARSRCISWSRSSVKVKVSDGETKPGGCLCGECVRMGANVMGLIIAKDDLHSLTILNHVC